MNVEESLGYWSLETSHSFSHHRNENGISEDKIIEVSTGDGKHGYWSLNTTHSSSCNRRFFIVVMVIEVGLGINRLDTLTLLIVEFIIW